MGSRIIPTSLRKEIIDRIHYAHLGIVGCLRRARLSVYWPNMTRQLTENMGKCEICNRLRNQGQQEKMPLRRWTRQKRRPAYLSEYQCT